MYVPTCYPPPAWRRGGRSEEYGKKGTTAVFRKASLGIWSLSKYPTHLEPAAGGSAVHAWKKEVDYG